ncbi:MAG TPA: MauE/DoxX family redox-associated membrane protein [Ilumatobacteraceae bacterium]|nr:MauE/DoxX family redox-associated membrane protein [Ilumatobacteraceae bacterium]
MAALASVLLGIAFLVAGGSKLAAGAAWPEQARGLGAPSVVVPALPWLELALGAALVVQLVPAVTGTLAIVLLGAFTVLIVRRLAQGRHPPCACFGAWSSKPLGWGHVARNLVLVALAVVTVATA